MPEMILYDAQGRRCLTANAAGRRLGVSHEAIRLAIERGVLPATRAGRMLLVPIAALRRYRPDQVKRRSGAAGGKARRKP